MHKTKMIKVNLPHRQFWIFSLTVNLLVLAVSAPSLLAQANTQSAELQTANHPAVADLEPQILSEINRVRTNPRGYAQWLEQQRQYYDGIWLKLPGEKAVRTNKGKKALEEAIAFLKEQQPLPPLKSSAQTAAAATTELANFANAKNIQYFSYGRKTATGIVMGLVIDELFPDRRRRQSLLSPNAADSGVVCKPDPRYAKVCAIAYSDSPTTDLASNNNTQVAISKPEVTTPAKTQPPVVELPAAKPPETKPPEVIIPDPKPEPQSEPQQAADQPAQAEEEQATLPVPPQPQAPPTPTVNNQPEPEPEPQATVEAKDEEAKKDEVSQAEIESEIAEIVEENQTEEVAEAEIVTESAPEEVAINLENSGFTERVEKGALEEGDRVIADDGSLYDFYPIQGKKGDSFTIYLESDEFDAFVALVDSNGKTIDENDDISQQDSNSQIKVTLPADGIYNVIVNTYDEKGTGEYILTVSR
ncbi:MAG: pre-peptidase C-terminal domain-containing protein [Cyanobacteria bacterium P01_C01_bin.72]